MLPRSPLRYDPTLHPRAARVARDRVLGQLASRGVFSRKERRSTIEQLRGRRLLILALLFGIAHARNPSATVFSTVNVALAAVWLSFAFFSAGGMALAWGLHFGWNAGLAILFDAPVSGYAFQVPVVEYTPGWHAWVDGGPFGPEGGIVTTIVLIAGTLAVIGARVKQPRTWLAG